MKEPAKNDQFFGLKMILNLKKKLEIVIIYQNELLDNLEIQWVNE
jgi:hypothetical protein